jgi:hypothetical protein
MGAFAALCRFPPAVAPQQHRYLDRALAGAGGLFDRAVMLGLPLLT